MLASETIKGHWYIHRQTFNLPVQELNEAPLEAKRVIQKATAA